MLAWEEKACSRVSPGNGARAGGALVRRISALGECMVDACGFGRAWLLPPSTWEHVGGFALSTDEGGVTRPDFCCLGNEVAWEACLKHGC